MTKKDKRAFKKHIRESLKKRIEEKNKPRPDYIPPRYDDVYFAGVAWLDTL